MIGSEVNLAELLTPTYTGASIRRYFGGAWSMHLPFAWDLVRELEPRILVELGVYKGESYFGFCQSVEENKLTTLCYGVDTWQGDPQTGMYGPEIGQEIEAYNVRYSRFSRLLKMTFKDASSQFGAGSIDLLHIDGAHRYKDVKEDFETWLPKVSDRGIILFHDVMVRNRGFGVWRLWLEIARTQPSFVFEFGHGLGVWKKNAVSEDDPPFIRKLLSAMGREREEIVRHYAIAAAAIDLKAKETKRSRATSRLQVFAPRYGTYTENHSNRAEIPIGAWHRVRVDLPWSLGDGSGGLRLDPGNEVAIIDIAGILLRSKLTGKVVWRARGPAELSNLAVGGTAIALPDERLFRIFSFGEDPQVIIPRLSEPEFAVPLRLEAWVHFERSVQAIGRAMAAFYRQVQEENKSKQDKIEQERFVLEAKLCQVQEENKSKQDKIAVLEQERFVLEAKLRQVQEENKSKQDKIAVLEQERFVLEAKLRQVQKENKQERFVLEAKLRQVQEENKSKQDKIAALISENQTMERALAAAHFDSEAMRKGAWKYKAYRADLTTRLKDRDRRIQEIERSLAWKITKPFWKLERHFKRTPEQIAAAGQLVFALDGPGTWNALYDVFTLKGWCYSHRRPQIVGVRAKVGGKSYFARYGLKREPVAQTAPNYPPALHSGFSVDVPVPKGISSIRLEAIAQGSRWERFLEHPVPPRTERFLEPPVPPRTERFLEPPVPPRTDQPQVPAHGDGSVQSAGAEPLNLKDSEYGLTPPVLFPVAAANPYFTVTAQLPRGTGRRLICVSHVMPYPPRAGNEYRIHRMLTWMVGRNWDILLVVCPLPNETVTERQLAEAAGMYPNLIVCRRDGTLFHRLSDGGAMLEELRGRRPDDFAALLGETNASDDRERKLLAVMRTFCPDALAQLLLHLEAKFDPHVLLAEYVFMTRPFALLRPGLFKIIDTIDVFSTTYDNVVRYGIEDGLALDPEIEAELLNRADLIIAIQATEADALRKLAPQRQVISVGVDFTVLKDALRSTIEPVILLVASGNARNIKGLKDFLRFAWPLILRALPEAELRVIGSVGEGAEPALPGVKILGHVEDLAAAYAEARVIINPAVAGTGLKIKTVEALCHFRPIVLWPSGVEGVEPQVRGLCHVATDWFDFARHVIRLAGEEDGAQVLVDRRATLAHQFAPESVYALLGAVLDDRQMMTHQTELGVTSASH